MGLDCGAVVVGRTVHRGTRGVTMPPTVLSHCGDLVTLRDGVLHSRRGLHTVGHSLINSRSRGSGGQDAMLEGLGVPRKAPLLGRKNRFLILQSPLHYELILVRTARPLS